MHIIFGFFLYRVNRLYVVEYDILHVIIILDTTLRLLGDTP